MRSILLIFISVFSFQSYGQKSYRIEKLLWNYTQPSEYISRVDNFEEEVKAGQEYIREEEDESTHSNDDKILFAIAKSDSAEMNIVLASFKNNGNIEKFTLEGYAEQLGEYLKENPKNDELEKTVTVSVSDITIDKIRFYLIIKTTDFTKKDYSFTSDYYVTEVQGKEFSIADVYDNEIDKQKIKKSILESTFE